MLAEAAIYITLAVPGVVSAVQLYDAFHLGTPIWHLLLSLHSFSTFLAIPTKMLFPRTDLGERFAVLPMTGVILALRQVQGGYWDGSSTAHSFIWCYLIAVFLVAEGVKT